MTPYEHDTRNWWARAVNWFLRPYYGHRNDPLAEGASYDWLGRQSSAMAADMTRGIPPYDIPLWGCNAAPALVDPETAARVACVSAVLRSRLPEPDPYIWIDPWEGR